MEKKTKESTVYLKDILFSILYAWKAVLCVALILAVLLGGYKFMTAKTATPASSAAVEAYEETKLLLQQKADTLQAQLDTQEAFIQDSLLMQLDPYCHYLLTVRCYIDTDYQIDPSLSQQTPSKAPALLKSYSGLITGEQFMLALSEAIGTQPQYLTELTKVEADVSGVLTIQIQLPTQEDAQQLSALLDAQLLQLQPQLEATVTAHTLQILENTVNANIDRALVATQKTENDRLTTLNTQLTDAKKAVSALMPPAGASGRNMKSVVKFAVLGGGLGVFVAAIFLCIRHIASDKIYSARTLNDETGCRILVCVSDKRYGPVLRWLRKLDGRVREDQEHQLPLIAAHIHNHCKAGDKLLLAGSVDQAQLEALSQQLRELCKDVTILTGGNLLKDAAAVDALRECSCVMLVETCGKSLYTDADRQAVLAAEQKKNVLGFVLYGG